MEGSSSSIMAHCKCGAKLTALGKIVGQEQECEEHQFTFTHLEPVIVTPHSKEVRENDNINEKKYL